jgi:hypothetical protein
MSFKRKTASLRYELVFARASEPDSNHVSSTVIEDVF